MGISPIMKVPDETIFMLGDESDLFYFISNGQVQIQLEDHFGRTEIVQKYLEKGDFFGELGILNNCKRTATIVTANYSNFATFSGV